MAYAPGVQDRSGELFARGMQSGIQNGMMALQQGLADHKKNQEENDSINAGLKGIVPFIKDDPKAWEQFGEDLVGAPSQSTSKRKALLGSVVGYIAQKQAQDQAAQKAAMDKAMISSYEINQKRFENETLNQDALDGMIADIGDGRPENFLYALKQNPRAAKLLHPDNLLKILDQQGGGQAGPAVIDQFDLPNGYKGAAMRGSRDLKTFPPAPGANPVLSEDKLSMFNGRTWTRIGGQVEAKDIYNNLSRRRSDLQKAATLYGKGTPEGDQAIEEMQAIAGDMQGLASAHKLGGGGAQGAASAAGPSKAKPLAAGEVIRVGPNGERLVYDAKTKAFLRHAD